MLFVQLWRACTARRIYRALASVGDSSAKDLVCGYVKELSGYFSNVDIDGDLSDHRMLLQSEMSKICKNVMR